MPHPVYDEDLFSADAIRDPYPHYAAIRDLGPVVALPRYDVLAVARHADVRAVLADDATFRSGDGVLWSDVANRLTRGTTLASDEPEHGPLRQVVAHRLTPRALRDQRASVEATARELVDRVVAQSRADGGADGVVDGVTDLAQAMPMAVVPEFLGFPEDCRPRLLEWAGGAIEAGAPWSDRTPEAVRLATELGQYAESLVAERRLTPGSLGADVLGAADAGVVDPGQCPALLLDYFGPSLETTISALGSALALFADHPDQWDLLRADPALVTGAFNEVVRLESPLRGFTRVAAHDTVVDGAAVAAGTRVAVLYASANRDERRWDRPDVFDITRDNADHVGLGYGAHGCAGQGLARLEIGAVLTHLARSVVRIERVGAGERAVAGLLRAWRSLPLRLHTDPAAAVTA